MSAAPRRLPVYGPDPTRPCVGCSRRTNCRAPCEKVEALLPVAVEASHDDVSSERITRGDVYSAALAVLHPALEPDEEPLRWPALVRRYHPRLQRLLTSRRALTPAQRAIVRALLAGLSRGEVGQRRGVARQNVHKALHRAIERLQRLLPPPSPRGDQLGKSRRSP